MSGAIAACFLAGCSAGFPSASPEAPSSAPSASSRPSSFDATPTLAPSPTPSNPPAPSLASTAPTSVADAAARLLASDSATFELVATRFKPNVPADVTAVAAGMVDPAGDRGRMRYEFFPNDPEGSPFALGPFDIVWDPTDYWVLGHDELDGAWQHTSRAEAPGMALIGRVNEEPLGLLRMAAAAPPDKVELAPPADLSGKPAERWLVSVLAEAAGEAFIPPETYAGFSQVFGRPDIPLEVWVVDGEIARVGYVLEREKAPYGGPDRIETWYDWSAIGESIDLTVPPSGRIEEIGD